MSTLLHIALAGAALLPASVLTRRVEGAPPKQVKSVRVHAYALSSSTWVGIDSTLIRYDAPLKKRLKQPARFIRQLEAALATRDTVALQEFKPSLFASGFTSRIAAARVAPFTWPKAVRCCWAAGSISSTRA